MPSIDNQEKVAVDFTQQAELYLAEGKFEEAIAACEAALQVQANFFPACKTMGKVLQAQGQLEEAHQWYQQAIALDPNCPEVYANLGSWYAQQQQWQEAVTSYQKAIALQPDFAGVYRNLARVFSQLNQSRDAADCWYQALTIDPNWATAEEHLTLGNMLVEQQKFEEAISCYHRAIERNPNFVTAYHNLGETLRQQGQLESGKNAYRQAIELNPEYAASHYGLGKVLAAQEQWQAASACYRQALDLGFNSFKVYLSLGDALAKQGEFDEAVSSYQKAIELQPNSWEAYEKLGDISSKNLHLEAAIDAYRHAIEINPNAFLSHHQLVQTFFKLKQWDRAVMNARRTIELHPNLPWPYTQLGNALVELDQLEEAAICHQKASELRGWYQCVQRGYQFTRDWFTHNIPIWEKYLKPLAELKGLKILEIGSFQGMSACWLLDHILTDPSASITCIEPNFQEQFDGNIAKTGAGAKVKKLEALSYQVLGEQEADAYELVYIDGCHLAASVLEDAILSWRLVKVGGLIIFDDYEWTEPDTLIQTTKIGIDTFLALFQNQVELIHKGYQLIVRKIAPEVPKEMLDTGSEFISFRAYKALADALTEQGNLDVASAYYRKAIELQNGGDPEAHHKLGDLLKSQEQFQEAVAAYSRAIELDPDFFWSYNNLGDTLLKLEKWEEAVTIYRQAITLKSDFFWSYNNLGDALFKLEKWEEAVVAYRQTFDLNSDSYWAAYNLGKTLGKLEKWVEAAVAYRRAIELAPDRGLFHYNLGEVLAKQQQWQEAAAAYQCAVELELENIGLHKILQEALQKASHLEDAIAFYQKQIPNYPHYYWLYENLGQLLMQQQKWEEAIACFIKALQIKPDLFDSYQQIILAIEQQNLLEDEVERFRTQHNYLLPSKLVEKFCCLTGDWAVTSESDSSISYIKIYPENQINILASQTIDSQNLFCQHTITTSKAYVAVVPDGRAWGDAMTTAVITSGNKLVKDISMGNPELVISSDQLPAAHPLDGTVAFLSARWASENYAHWIFDLVTRLALLYESGIDVDSIDNFVINCYQKRYEIESLVLLGIPPSKIINNCEIPHLKAKRLIVPSVPRPGEIFITPWGCKLLKQKILKDQELQNPQKPERIYLSRQQASFRRVLNEEAVFSVLEKYGFQRLYLETMSLAEQAFYLATAKVIVAPHGAGLANLVFCSPGTKVIEFFAPKYVESCYWILSNFCDLQHYYLLGENLNDDSLQLPVHQNILLDLEKLENILRLAGVGNGASI